MSGKEALDLFIHARRFGFADNYIRECEKDFAPMMAVPALVLSSFAVELYFKCLQVLILGKLFRGHDLFELFAKLPQKTQDEISASWNVCVLKIEELLVATEKSSGESIPRDLVSHLKLGALAFPNLRYPGSYQTQSFFLGDLPRLLDEYIVTIRADWKQQLPSLIVKGENIPIK